MVIEIKPATDTQVVMRLANQRQDDLKDVSIQIATGNKYSEFKGLADDGTLERFISLTETMDKTNNYMTSNDIIISRISATEQAISELQEIASDVAQLIVRRRNSASGQNVGLAVQAQSMLKDIEGQLNVKYDGRHLFAGSKTNTKPVQNITTSTIGTGNAATASYYNGDTAKPSIQVNDTQTVEYGVLGNETGFQELIGAVHLAISGDAADDDTLLAAAATMIDNAVTNLTSVRANTVSTRLNIERANSVLKDTEVLIGENLIDVSQTDIVEATTRMSELEATIQATYMAFTRLNSLRLSNFLN